MGQTFGNQEEKTAESKGWDSPDTERKEEHGNRSEGGKQLDTAERLWADWAGEGLLFSKVYIEKLFFFI